MAVLFNALSVRNLAQISPALRAEYVKIVQIACVVVKGMLVVPAKQMNDWAQAAVPWSSVKLKRTLVRHHDPS